jgi:orotate phosphoribosyltransferase
LRSGQTSSWYLDARQTTLDGGGALLVGEVLLEVLDGTVEAVGGMTMGADPMAVAASVIAAQHGRNLRAFSIRKVAKDHGTGGRLVGPVIAGDRVALLEDTTTTGGALMEALAVAQESSLDVVQVVALIDRSEGGVTSLLEAQGIPYAAILTPRDLGVEP